VAVAESSTPRLRQISPGHRWLWRSLRRHGWGFTDSAPATDLV